jgi:hypothetical protein
MAAPAQNLKRLVRHLTTVCPTEPGSRIVRLQTRRTRPRNRRWLLLKPLRSGEFFNNHFLVDDC